MKIDKMNRRMFLVGTGGLLMSIPFLPSLARKVLAANRGGITFRYISINHGHGGLWQSNFFPPTPEVGDYTQGLAGLRPTHGLGYMQALADDGRFPDVGGWGRNYYAYVHAMLANQRPNNRVAAAGLTNGTGYDYYSDPLTDYVNRPLRSGLRGFSELLPNTVLGQSELEHTTIIRGLDVTSYRHGHSSGGHMGNLGRADGFPGLMHQQISNATVDQVLARSPGFDTRSPRSMTINFGQWSDFNWVRNSNGRVVAVPYEGGNFQQIFRDNIVLSSGSTAEEVAVQPVQAMNKVMDDIHSVRRKISSEERHQFEEYLESIHSIVTNPTMLGIDLGSGSRAATGDQCGDPPIPMSNNLEANDGSGNTPDHGTISLNETTFRRCMQDMANLAMALIKCDVTRVVNLNVEPVMSDQYVMPGTNPDGSPVIRIVAGGDFHQNIYHSPPSGSIGLSAAQRQEAILRSYRRIADSIFRPLINGLNAEEDPLSSNGGSYLYNSLVHWTMESQGIHHQDSIPTILAGHAGGNIITNQYLDYRVHNRGYRAGSHLYLTENACDEAQIPGVPINRFWVSLLRSMGLHSSSFITDHLTRLNDSNHQGSPAENEDGSPISGISTRVFRTYAHVFHSRDDDTQANIDRIFPPGVLGVTPADHHFDQNPLFRGAGFENCNLHLALPGLHPLGVNIDDDEGLPPTGYLG